MAIIISNIQLVVKDENGDNQPDVVECFYTRSLEEDPNLREYKSIVIRAEDFDLTLPLSEVWPFILGTLV